MRYYNCLVKLGGDPVLMQAPRLHISEDELKILRHIHGNDAISQLNQCSEQDVDRATHLYQLARYYNDRKMVETLFRVTLDNFEGWLEDALIAEEQEREQRFQLSQIQQSTKRAATMTVADSVGAPGAATGRGVDPGANNTTGIAAAAAALQTSAEQSAERDITAKRDAVQPAIGKAPAGERERVAVD